MEIVFVKSAESPALDMAIFFLLWSMPDAGNSSLVFTIRCDV